MEWQWWELAVGLFGGCVFGVLAGVFVVALLESSRADRGMRMRGEHGNRVGAHQTLH